MYSKLIFSYGTLQSLSLSEMFSYSNGWFDAVLFDDVVDDFDEPPACSRLLLALDATVGVVVVLSLTYSVPSCGVVWDLDGIVCTISCGNGYDWWRDCVTVAFVSFPVVICDWLTLKWYKLFAPFAVTKIVSFSTPLVPLLLITMGFLASGGRVSMIPVIVSAGPTMTLSQVSFGSIKFSRLNSSSVWSILHDVFNETLCLGTGGATVLGTSKSQVVMFSVLCEKTAIEFVVKDRFIRLDAELTCACVFGFSIRLIELSTFGDDFRGGSGGASGSCFFTSLMSADCALLSALLTICCWDDDVECICGADIRFVITCDEWFDDENCIAFPATLDRVTMTPNDFVGAPFDVWFPFDCCVWLA